MPTQYFFQVEYQGQRTTVTPTNFKKNKFSWARGEGQIFFRKSYNGTIVFDAEKNDFDFFWNIERSGNSCDDIYLYVYACGRVIWKAVFSTGAGKFNLDRCTFEIHPEVYDKYNCFLSSIKNEFDLLQLPLTNYSAQALNNSIGVTHTLTVVRVELGLISGDPCSNPSPAPFSDKRGDTLYYLDGVLIDEQVNDTPSTMVDLTQWCLINAYGNSYTACIEEVDLIQQYTYTTHTDEYSREVISIPCVSGTCDPPDGTGWIELSSDCSILGTCTYYRCSGGNEVFDTNKMLNEVIGYVVDQMDCPESLLIRSIFLDINPDVLDSVYLLTAGGTLNYVTNDVSWTKTLMIDQKTNYTMPNATNPATHATLTLEIILYWLNKMFDVYWDITDTGELIIEHELYFELHAPSYNLLGKKKEQEGNNSYEHNNDEIPEEESFSFMENDPDKYTLKDFQGTPIKYHSTCSTETSNTSTVIDDLTTNIEFIHDYPDAISDDGFVMVATQNAGGGLYNINKENTLWTNVVKVNGHLSWPNLQYNYLRYGRYLSTGEMNGIQTKFITWKPNVRQTAIEFAWCCADGDFNPAGKFITYLSTKYLNQYLDCTFNSPNLLTNGDFATGSTGWTLGTAWTYSSGMIAHSSPAGSATQSVSGLVVGQIYTVKVTISSLFGGYCQISLGGGAYVQFLALAGGNATHTFDLVCGNVNDLLEIHCDASCGIDDISMTTFQCGTRSSFAQVKTAEYDLLKDTLKIVFEYSIWQR